MMKTCIDCKVSQPSVDFPANGKNRSARCRPCKQKYDRAYHSARSAESKQRKRQLQVARVKDFQQRVWTFKLKNPCVDCGETDPIVLDLDHIDSATKESDICSLVAGGASWLRIEAEMSKCVVRCSNCHRRRTHKQFGWFNGCGEDGNPAALEALDTRFDSEVPDVATYKVGDKIVLTKDFELDGKTYKKGLKGKIDSIRGYFYREFEITFTDGRRVGFNGNIDFKRDN